MINKMTNFSVNTVVNFATFLLVFFYLINLDFTHSNVYVLLTFFINGLFSFVKIITSKRNVSLSRILYIFIFIFMCVAPLQQYTLGLVFWAPRGLSINYTSSDYIFANFLILIFMIVFEFGYSKITRLKKIASNTSTARISEPSMSRQARITIFIIAIIAFVFLAASGLLLAPYEEDSTNVNLIYQIFHVIKFLPLSALVLFILNQLDYHQNSLNFWIQLWLLALMNFIIFFPLSGANSRFLMFGAYLLIVTLLTADNGIQSLLFLAFIIGFFFVFSSFNIFKTGGTYAEFALSTKTSFNSVDFDAYQIFMATVHYVKEYGVSFGGNLISAALCFVPRSIFTFRLLPTGGIVVSSFGSNYVNVSSPVFGEIYFAFGFLGYIPLSFLVGKLFISVDEFWYSGSYFKRAIFAILCGFEIYILRGSLLSTWSYTLALILAFALIYMISKCLTGAVSQSKRST